MPFYTVLNDITLRRHDMLPHLQEIIFLNSLYLKFQDNCTIRFMANHTSNGTFAVAVTVEDYPKSNISVDGSIHLTTSPLSTITLQVRRLIIYRYLTFFIYNFF